MPPLTVRERHELEIELPPGPLSPDELYQVLDNVTDKCPDDAILVFNIVGSDVVSLTVTWSSS